MNRAPSPQRDEEIEESVDMPMEVYVPAPEMVAMIDKVESIKISILKLVVFWMGQHPSISRCANVISCSTGIN